MHKSIQLEEFKAEVVSPIASKCSQKCAVETDPVLSRYPQTRLACRLKLRALLFKIFHQFLTPDVQNVSHHQLTVQFLTGEV